VAAAFLKRVDWLRCLVPFQKEEQLAQPCFAAFDLSKVEDMTSLVLCFRRPEGRYRFQPYFWLPEETASADGVRDSYQKWKAEGILFTTPGRVCDYSAIAAHAAEIFKAHRVQKFAYDPWQAEQFSQDIEKLTGIERFEFRQSLANFAEATSEFERLVISGKLEHDGHKILTWQAGNAKVYSDANGNKRPVKPKHDDKRKIDGIVASIMALGLAWLTESGESVYNTPDRPEGLIVL
jgi:phage terminase large subunit-like protein